MKNKIINDYFSTKYIACLSLLISVLLQVVLYFSSYFNVDLPSIPDNIQSKFHLDGFILNIINAFIFSFTLYLVCRGIQLRATSNKRRLIYTIIALELGVIVLGAILTILHPILLNALHDGAPPFRMDIGLLCYGFVRYTYIAIVVGCSWELFVLNYNKQKAILENEILVSKNHIARFEALKNQINPHFLFNSLNTLQSLIVNDKAKDYVQELSNVLRYTLQKDEIVSLKKEIQFTNSYCDLMQIRYGENLSFNFDIDERMMNDEIIPLSIQILIENAIKHNVISDRQPLVVSITSDIENRRIVVCNKIQPKTEESSGNGIGLANLSERYKLKWNYEIEIYNDGVYFCVGVKLNKVKSNL